MPLRHGRTIGGRRHLLVLLLAVPLVVSACTFERRPDRRNGEEEPDTAAVSRTEILEDSMEAMVDAFVEALRAGDVSRAVGMLHGQATLYDEETGRRWGPMQVDSLLPGPMGREGEELRREPSDSWVEVYDPAAVVVRRYRPAASREAAARTALETYVLVRTDGGWAIRHLHRSQGPDPGS